MSISDTFSATHSVEFVNLKFRQYSKPCEFKSCDLLGSLNKDERPFKYCSCVCKTGRFGDACELDAESSIFNPKNNKNPNMADTIEPTPQLKDARGDLILVVDINPKGTVFF